MKIVVEHKYYVGMQDAYLTNNNNDLKQNKQLSNGTKST